MDGDDNGATEGFTLSYGLLSLCSSLLFGIISFPFPDSGISAWGMSSKSDNLIALTSKSKETDHFVVWEYFFNFYELTRWYTDIVQPFDTAIPQKCSQSFTLVCFHLYIWRVFVQASTTSSPFTSRSIFLWVFVPVPAMKCRMTKWVFCVLNPYMFWLTLQENLVADSFTGKWIILLHWLAMLWRFHNWQPIFMSLETKCPPQISHNIVICQK